MVEKINSRIQQYNYNTINGVKPLTNTSVGNIEKTIVPSFTAAMTVPLNPQQNVNINLRTELTTKEEKNEYTKVLSRLDKMEEKFRNNAKEWCSFEFQF